MDANRKTSRLVSFSGIDGAGKSSQIDHLKAIFERQGLRVRVIAFWDEIATLKRLRESAGHSIFKGDKGVGSPEAPINRKDKNVRSLPMTVVRLILYLLDAVSNRRASRRAAQSGADLVIFDRYIYDELANLDLANPFTRLYAQMILKLVPKPQIAFVLDADPVQARARKPEYPLEFLIVNRKTYLALGEMTGTIAVVPPFSIDHVKEDVAGRVCELFSVDAGLASPLSGRQGTSLESVLTESQR